MDEYQEKRGLYLDLKETLPCVVHEQEDSLLEDIKNVDVESSSQKTHAFHLKFTPYAGRASKVVVDEIIKRLNS